MIAMAPHGTTQRSLHVPLRMSLQEDLSQKFLYVLGLCAYRFHYKYVYENVIRNGGNAFFVHFDL